MKDYIIVGSGIAGISFAETAFKNGKSFVVISDESQNSSRVAGGIYNPVIVKRLSMPANAADHMAYIEPFYARIESRLQLQFMFPLPLYRRFTSVEEQNDWFTAADKPGLSEFLSTAIVRKKYDFLSSPFGFGEVLRTGYMDTVKFIESYSQFLANTDCLVKARFDYDALTIEDSKVNYKDITAKHIIFAEGFGIHKNPYFNDLPLNGTKGELLLIKAPGLNLNAIVNAGIFILPIGDDLYKVGATYEWTDKTNTPTETAKIELLQKLEEIMTCPYEVIEHYAGIRPTTKDRKALVGTHNEYDNVHLLNGLGTRGVMLGPPMAKQLYDSIENGVPLDKTVDLNRFRN